METTADCRRLINNGKELQIEEAQENEVAHPPLK